MKPPFPSGHLARFGVFELDLRARELRKNGNSTGLPEQSIKLLALLLEKPGEVVLREEMRKKLWPNDTVVEFDHSINAAMKRLRQALDDSPGDPQFIETLARRGYRWKILVEWPEAQGEVAARAKAEGAQIASGGSLVGTKVSHYRVLEVLGGGGMGVVYKAEDIKLGRRVALKFLPEEMASEPSALERFEREARAASALDHPNICAIYEFGEHEAQHFIAMQLLEGQTLRECIGAHPPQPGKPLPMDELLDFAIQITRGLEAAHQKGIIHRDIKPVNIFITDRGEAKILDFGVAKLIHGGEPLAAAGVPESKNNALEPGPASSSLSLTRTGTTVGTASYMSPEQVLGESLDARTDLFSFGLVLHEMATGQQAFAGNTAEMVHEAILRQPVQPARTLNPDLPSKVEEVIAKALAKDRDDRYQDASKMRSDLEELQQNLAGKARAGWRELVAAVTVLILITSAAFWFAKRQSASKNPPLELKLRQLTSNSSESPVEGTISPDGRYLAYTDRVGMHIKRIEGGETQTIPQPDGLKTNRVDWEIGPWFPDGARFLAHTHPPGGDASNWTSRGTSIWVVSVLGGPPHKLRDEAYADAISRDGSTIAFDTNPGRLGDREIWLMGSNGEQARKLFDTGENSSISELNWSPDEQRALYKKIDEAGPGLVSRDLKGGPPVAILAPPEANRLNDYLWLPDGRMIYALKEPDPDENTCNYWQIRIDSRSGAPVEKPRRITNLAGFCVGGTSVTSDSKRLTFGKWRPHISVYVADLQASGTRITTPTRLTLDEGWNGPLGWTADGKAVVFFSNRDGTKGLFKQSLGQSTAEPLSNAKEDGYILDACLSPEGSWVLYKANPDEGGPPAPGKLMRVPVTGGSPQLVLTANLEEGPRCAKSPATLCAIAERSADGKQLVFSAFDPLKGRGRELCESKTSATAEYWWDLSPDGSRIALLQKMDRRIQILSLNGRAPQEITVKGWDPLTSAVWTADGKGLFVSSLTERGSVLLSVDLRGNARVLWELTGGVGTTYGVPSPDGRHLALLSWTLESNIWMMENF